MRQKSILTILFAFCLFLCCVDDPLHPLREGPSYLEITSVKALAQDEIKAYFSEPVSEMNADPGYFKLTNASTGDTLPLAGASVSGQAITLTVEAPRMLAADHVYDLQYYVAAKDNAAKTFGKERFVADFLPPDDEIPVLAAWKDSALNVLLLWTPNNRIGNTAMEIWRISMGDRVRDSMRLVSLESDRSAYWTGISAGQITAFALKAVNKFGESSIGTWIYPANASVDTFECIGTCLKDLAWDSLPAGYGLVSAATTCDRVEYFNADSGSTLIREITEFGILETFRDSSGAVLDTIPDLCAQ